MRHACRLVAGYAARVGPEGARQASGARGARAMAGAAASTAAFGDLLRAYRVAAGLSQETLAARAGLSARGISDLERGTRRAPRSETLRRLVGPWGRLR